VYIPAPPQPKEVEAKSPTPFTGADHTKLRDFLFECGLVFKNKHRTFTTDETKITYAIQYLDGVAKRHFRRFIETQSNDPKVNDWAVFAQELQTIFGDPDRTKRASRKLLNLKMKDNGRVHDYTVQFKEAADEVGWSNDILQDLYYNGLPDRIQDLWAQHGPPPVFDNLVREAQNYDNRYWQHLAEKKQALATPARTSDPKPPFKPTTSTSNPSSTFQQASQPKSTSASTSSRSTSSAPKSSNAPSKDLTTILGPDGKLKPEEKARRKKLGLCSYRGSNHEQCNLKPSGSSSKDSDKPSTPSKSTSNAASSSKPKGRVAQVVDSGDASDTGDAAATDF